MKPCKYYATEYGVLVNRLDQWAGPFVNHAVAIHWVARHGQ